MLTANKAERYRAKAAYCEERAKNVRHKSADPTRLGETNTPSRTSNTHRQVRNWWRLGFQLRSRGPDKLAPVSVAQIAADQWPNSVPTPPMTLGNMRRAGRARTSGLLPRPRLPPPPGSPVSELGADPGEPRRLRIGPGPALGAALAWRAGWR
jgi:hypothetical protein